MTWRRGDGVEVECVRGGAERGGEVFQEHPPGVAVGGDRVGGKVTLGVGEGGEVGLQAGGQGVHDGSPSAVGSSMPAARAMSSPGRGQVPVGVGGVGVPQPGGQQRQHSVGVTAVGVGRGHVRGGEGVPQVVQAGACPAARGEPGSVPGSLEQGLEGHVEVAGSLGGHEDRAVGVGVCGRPGGQGDVLAEGGRRRWVYRDQPFGGLRGLDHQHVGVEVDVVDSQVQRLADPQAGGDEQADDGAHRGGDPLVGELGGAGCEQRVDVVLAVDVGRGSGFPGRQQAAGDDWDVDTGGVEVGGEAAHQRQAGRPPGRVRVGVEPGPCHGVVDAEGLCLAAGLEPGAEQADLPFEVVQLEPKAPAQHQVLLQPFTQRRHDGTCPNGTTSSRSDVRSTFA